MTKNEMKAALARVDQSDWDWGDIGSKHGETAAKAVESIMDAGDKALDYLDGLWTGFKFERAKRAGRIAE